MNQNQHDWTWKVEGGKLVLYDQPEGGEVIAGPFSSWTEAQASPKLRAFAAAADGAHQGETTNALRG